MAKLLLVHPMFLAESPDEQAAESPYFPLGLLYLAAYVREQGHTVAVFDATFSPDRSAFDDALAEHQPDIVGISSMAATKDTALELARTADAAGALVVLGGPDATLDPAGQLHDPAVAIVVHHEGEQTLARLLDLHDTGDLDPSALDDELGLAFRRPDGLTVVTQPRPAIENLDELPTPARDLIDVERYLNVWQESKGYTTLTIATSRGCPYGCDWCRDAVHGDHFRQRSPEHVAAEVQSLRDEFGIDSVRLIDDVDGLDRDWVERWADAAEANDAVVPFEALNRVERTDLPMLEVQDTL